MNYKYEENILKLLKKYEYMNFLQIARSLFIPFKENQLLTKELNELKEKGIIGFSPSKKAYYFPLKEKTIKAKIKINNKGFVFAYEVDQNHNLILDRESFLIVNKNFNLIDQDIVLIDVFQDKDNENKKYAICKKLIKRKYDFFVCLIEKDYKLTPINFNPLSKEIKILNINEFNCLNCFCKLKIINISQKTIETKIVEIIGNIDTKSSDIFALVDSFNINRFFPQEVLDYSKNIPQKINSNDFYFNQRKDLRDDLIITIDGEKTKDFDDAINVKKTKEGYSLQVHIADVSYYVKKNDPIDLEAQKRTTSIYLLDEVIPMLPFSLSNGICSLNPNEDRYCLSVKLDYNFQGDIIRSNIFPSTINSKYRLTYKQVANYKEDEIIKKDLNLLKMLDVAYELSDILSQKKEQKGYINFEIKDPVIEINDKGEPTNIYLKPSYSSEILIENFMVAANEAVAYTLNKKNFPCVYRIHESPDATKLNDLQNILKILNINVKIPNKNITPIDFSLCVKKIKDFRFDNFIKMILLRTMQKAKYSLNNIGHFGLGLSYYSHFTSPIRRYPDLMIHRLIWDLLILNNSNNLKEENINFLTHEISICNSKEEEAVAIERKINDVKKAQFYQQKVDRVFAATIVTLTKFGIFAELEDKTSVLIHISTLNSDKEFILNEDNTKLSNETKTFTLGEQIKIKIVSTQKYDGKIDAIIV